MGIKESIASQEDKLADFLADFMTESGAPHPEKMSLTTPEQRKTAARERIKVDLKNTKNPWRTVGKF